jgi:hypothetical protein
MLKLSVFRLSLFISLSFLCYSQPVLSTTQIQIANYTKNELIKAGWDKDVAQAIVSLNKEWFTLIKQTDEHNFYRQINSLKKLGYSVIISNFLQKHPETVGLLALSDNPISLIKVLNKPACYNAMINLYALHTNPAEIKLLTKTLEKHRDLMCKLAYRGILGGEIVFMFTDNNKGAIEYDAWLKSVFCKYIWRSDRQLAEIIGFLIEKGPSIRQRLNKDPDFYKRFRQELWSALMRVVDNNGAFEQLANDPYIWDLLTLREGELLLNKWGLGPVTLLFGENAYPTDMQPIIISMLLQGDDNTVEALFRYKNEPLFRDLIQRPLSAITQAALANKLLSICPNYPEQACPDLTNSLRSLASITNQVALAEEVGVLPNGPTTWIPYHGSYYAIKKMTDGRKLSGDDLLNLGLDALSLVPAAFFAGPFGPSIQPLTESLIVNLGNFSIAGLNALSFTPYPYHLVKPISSFMIRTGNQTTKLMRSNKIIITQQTNNIHLHRVLIAEITRSIGALVEESQKIFKHSGERIFYEMTQPIVFIHQIRFEQNRNGNTMRLLEFKTSIFMRRDRKLVILANKPYKTFFNKIGKKALFVQKDLSAWQQTISAWWLMNTTIAP